MRYPGTGSHPRGMLMGFMPQLGLRAHTGGKKNKKGAGTMAGQWGSLKKEKKSSYRKLYIWYHINLQQKQPVWGTTNKANVQVVSFNFLTHPFRYRHQLQRIVAQIHPDNRFCPQKAFWLHLKVILHSSRSFSNYFMLIPGHTSNLVASQNSPTGMEIFFIPAFLLTNNIAWRKDEKTNLLYPCSIPRDVIRDWDEQRRPMHL